MKVKLVLVVDSHFFFLFVLCNCKDLSLWGVFCDLRQEIYLFQQNLTLSECFLQCFFSLFGFLLFPLLLRKGVLFAADEEWLFGLDICHICPAAGAFGCRGLTGAEAFLCLALYFFDVSAIEFALVFFQVGS